MKFPRILSGYCRFQARASLTTQCHHPLNKIIYSIEMLAVWWFSHRLHLYSNIDICINYFRQELISKLSLDIYLTLWKLKPWRFPSNRRKKTHRSVYRVYDELATILQFHSPLLFLELTKVNQSSNKLKNVFISSVWQLLEPRIPWSSCTKQQMTTLAEETRQQELRITQNTHVHSALATD